ncbi:hypothetical protein [Streptomyces sp. CC208A]|uniref:hypothetical protein n=1 Tax=Streptomyces sp. CC208A TaxID=3044573 RepID=UPI0024A8EDD5|nr:hypothetical protein [Streptomyces sp. CC208A]
MLIAFSVGALSLGTVTASQALGGAVDPAAHVRHGAEGEGRDKGGDHVVIDKSKHNLNHSCKGTFGYCTQNAVFAPKLIGDVGLIGTNGLIGLVGTNGTDGTNGTNGTNGTDGTNGTSTPPEDAEWCSPGFWRNHPEEWPVPTTTPYSSVFGAPPPRSNNGIMNNAPTDPTLFEVVDNPQWYGGGAANRVADYLSDQDPRINYQGVRVDNCPL